MDIYIEREREKEREREMDGWMDGLMDGQTTLIVFPGEVCADTRQIDR